MLEWEHEGYGRLEICMWCLTEALTELGYDIILEKKNGPWLPQALTLVPGPKSKKAPTRSKDKR